MGTRRDPRRRPPAAALATTLATVLCGVSACSLSAPPPERAETAAAARTAGPAASPAPGPAASPTPRSAPAASPGTAPAAPLGPPTEKSIPVARGMVFGESGQQVSLQEASDQVVHSREWRRISRMRDRVEAIAERLQGRVPEEQAALTGTTADFGSFTYTYTADGSIQPDPTWVAEYIRTQSVPILGSVTCHKLMLPQLRAALQQVVDSGLADEIHPEEYGGCYVPRFIGSDPSNPVSLHTWGIAVDLNVPGNQRGVAGAIDRRVVGIMKGWGFAWGGDWDYTDPMHFELARLY